MSEAVPYNYELFQHFFEEYGLILLDSEMDEIHRICQRVYEKRDDSMPKELRQIKRKTATPTPK